YFDPKVGPPSRLLGVYLFDLLFDYDKDELRLRGTIEPISGFLHFPYTIASYTFDVLKPIKDGKADLFNARISYTEYYPTATIYNLETPITFGGDVVPVLEPLTPVPEPSTSVPEPLTIFGTATAFGGVILLKRKSFKMKKS
ncbi:MAG TPA: PEP-CTERM sorting domain-containing protein, partial [Phormidium sp.]